MPAPKGAIIAARGPRLVKIDGTGRERQIGRAAGQVFDIAVSSSGTGAFLASSGNKALVYGVGPTGIRRLASSSLTTTFVFPGRSGRPIVVARSLAGSVPPGLATTVRRGIPEVVDGVSLDGRAITGRVLASHNASALRVASTITGMAVPTGQMLPGSARPSGALPRIAFGPNATRPAAIRPSSAEATTPGCSVPRLSPTNQVPQAGPGQVQRAVDLAVTGNLTDQRPGNYLNMGLAAYQPSSDFPPVALAGGGSLPANVYLGILAQESNLDQASWHALPGIAGDPLIADYYGAAGTITTINYAKSDCGYGIGQITTGMDNGDTSVYSAHGQMKIAADYEENIAAGLQILEKDWNLLSSNGVVANNGSSADIENWYFAIWAYNTGWHTADSAGNYGLGWANNPANPDYPPNRTPFLAATYADAAHPGSWPYQERVFGWVSRPHLDIHGNPAYATPNWPTTNTSKYLLLPAFNAFCDATANCAPADVNIGGSSDPANPCGYSSLPSTDPLSFHCWWHKPAQWVSDNCSAKCTTQSLAFPVGSADPGQADPHPADCNSTLPSTAVIVDDLAAPADNVVGCTGMNWTTAGKFTLAYATDSNGNPVAAIDTHQLGAGFGGHLFFAHNRTAADTANLVTGTWTASLATHLYNVFVHMPSTGGTTDFANYQITDSTGAVTSVAVSQHTNQDMWVSLGDFNLNSAAKVTLNNITTDAVDGAHDVAWDAVAFVPISGTLVHHTYDAVSIFSPTQNIDSTTLSIVPDTPMRSMADLHEWGLSRTAGGPAWNNANTTVKGLLQYMTCASTKTTGCVGSATAAAATAWKTEVTQAGSVATGVSNGMTPAKLMDFANAKPDPTAAPATAFASDESYKIKTHIDVWWDVTTSGTIVPGSERAVVTSRTGTTSIPDWVLKFVNAMQSDYGINVPNLAYSELNANTYTGDSTAVPNPLSTGLAPGEAYLPHVDPITLDSTGKCVIFHTTNGGTIGYRPLDDQTSSEDASMSAWVAAIQNGVTAGKIPQSVADTAGDIYSMFFRGWGAGGVGEGSLFTHAGPIWQELHFEFCSDGSIVTQQAVADNDDNPNHGPVFQSYMPDLYLYYDNKMVDEGGAPTTSPAQTGNFASFTTIPGTGPSAYGTCNVSAIGNAGSPWGVPLPIPGVSENFVPPTVTFCDDRTSYSDPGAP